jgi:hypothetical protein
VEVRAISSTWAIAFFVYFSYRLIVISLISYKSGEEVNVRRKGV